MKHQARNSEFHLTPQQLRQLLLTALSVRDQVMLELFVYTGIRRAELKSLQMHDLDIDASRILIRRGKGGKQRLVYLPTQSMTKLRQYCSSLRSSILFPGREGSFMSLRNINRIVAKAGSSAGLRHPNPRYKNISPHLLRHSFARNWKRAGGSLESLQKILGHSSLRTTLDVYGTESQLDTEQNYHSLASHLVVASSQVTL